jgi:hypothetical protein
MTHIDAVAVMAAPAELDARITAAFADDATSDSVSGVLADVEAVANVAEAEAQDARARALDPLVEDLILARRAMRLPRSSD